MTEKLAPIFYRCPSCGATSKRIDILRGKAHKCHRCGMLMLAVE